MNKDSLVNGAILGIIFGIPIGVTTSMTSTVLGEALWIVILSAVETFLLVFVFVFLGATFATDYIVRRLLDWNANWWNLNWDRKIFLTFLILGECASVLIPVLVSAFVL